MEAMNTYSDSNGNRYTTPEIEARIKKAALELLTTGVDYKFDRFNPTFDPKYGPPKIFFNNSVKVSGDKDYEKEHVVKKAEYDDDHNFWLKASLTL